MRLDRELQRNILNDLVATYPDSALTQNSPGLTKWHTDEDVVIANLAYLNEHGLINFNHDRSITGAWLIHSITATARGMDFVADDGGLSAILGVVTIRLHDDTIKELIESKVRNSDLPDTEKKRFLDQLRELPAETTKHLVMKLVDLGLEKAPEALATIGSYLVRAPGLT